MLIFSYGTMIFLNDQIFFKRLQKSLQTIESKNERFEDFLETKVRFSFQLN